MELVAEEYIQNDVLFKIIEKTSSAIAFAIALYLLYLTTSNYSRLKRMVHLISGRAHISNVQYHLSYSIITYEYQICSYTYYKHFK